MAIINSVERIQKTPFVVSAIALLAIAVLAVAGRLMIRLYCAKRRQQALRFEADDALMVIGLACAFSGTVLLLRHVDELYDVAAATSGPLLSRPILTPAVTSSEQFKTLQIIWNVLLWSAVCSVKFSFFFFFRSLIRRLPGRIMVWWWAVVIFNIFTAAFCIAQFSLACPRSDEAGLRESSSPIKCLVWLTTETTTLFRFLSLLTTILSTFPVRIIWQVKIRWTQKLALGFSLCLTVIMIAVVVIRAAGLRNRNMLDLVWMNYWVAIGADVGLIMAAATALRFLFVASHIAAAEGRGGGDTDGSGDAESRGAEDNAAAGLGSAQDQQRQQCKRQQRKGRGWGSRELSALRTTTRSHGCRADAATLH